MSTASTERIQNLKDTITQTARQIKAFEQELQPLTASVQALQARLQPTDDKLRYGDFLSDSETRERNRINTELAALNVKIGSIRRCQSDEVSVLHQRQNDLHEATRPPVTAESLQAAVNTAQAALADVQTLQKAAQSELSQAKGKRAQVETLEQTERTALAKLKGARAEAFAQGEAGQKRTSVIQAVRDAETAARAATEQAEIGRAAMGRIEAAIERHEATLSDLDARLLKAQDGVKARQRDLDLFKGRQDYMRMLDGLLEAAARIKAADADLGRHLLKGISHEGVCTLDEKYRIGSVDIRPML